MKIFNIKKANRWKWFPQVRYVNFRKVFPNTPKHCFTQWFYFDTLMWGGRIWNIGIKHHQIILDFRLSWLDDMVFPKA